MVTPAIALARMRP